jgi:very-short-patch-repair endonuclease
MRPMVSCARLRVPGAGRGERRRGVASAAGLVVEVDGGAYQALRTAADGRRDEALRRAGYLVLRMQASLVVQRLEEAVVLVRGALPTPERR